MASRRSEFAGVALAVACVFAHARVARAEALEIRVLTYNAWDLPLVADDIAARIERIGPAINELEPDVVCFQELWVDADAARVASDLAKVGLTHTRRWPSGAIGSGLMIASRFPIEQDAFRR